MDTIKQSSPCTVFLTCHLPLVIAAMLMVLALYFVVLTSQGISDAVDAAAYQAAGRHMVEQGTFMPYPIPYHKFVNEGTASFGARMMNLPNYGYSLLQGVIGLARGDFSCFNAMLISVCALMLLVITSYFMMFTLVGKSFMAFVFALAVAMHALVMGLAVRPLSDIVLMAAFMLGLTAAIKGKPLLAGIMLGVGYLLREQALMFVPFLPLLMPQVTNWRALVKTGLIMGAAFVPFFLAPYAIKYWFSFSDVNQNFYMAHFVAWAKERWFTAAAMQGFWVNIQLSAKYLGPICLLPLAALIVRPSWFPPLARRMLIIGVVLALIPCFMWSFKIMPMRYLIYFVPLFYAAIALALARYAWKTWGFVMIMLVAMVTTFPSLKAGDFAALLNPREHLTAISEHIQEPMRVNKHFAPGSVILTSSYVPAFALQGAISVSLPTYDQFKASRGNEKLTGLIIFDRKSKLGWPNSEFITDDYGVTFQRLPDFSSWKAFSYYKYVSGPKE